MDGVEPLPYRLPELLATPASQPVWIFEGEKDCERAAGLGLVATTNHQGAASTQTTWPKFLSRWFQGRQCHVVPDNDPGGRRHAAGVAAVLLGMGAQVRLVTLPGLPAKGDFSTWLDLGGTLEELEHLALTAADFDLAAYKDVQPADVGGEHSAGLPMPAPVGSNGAARAGRNGSAETVAELMSTRLADVEPVEVAWLIRGKIPLGKLSLIAGAPGLGKSFCVLDFIARVSCGGDAPASAGESIPCGSCLLVSAEDDLADTIRPRLDAAGANTARIHAATTLRRPDGSLAPFDLHFIPELERLILELGDVQLVVIDPITSYLGQFTDDFRNTQVRAVLEPLSDMARRLGLAVLLVHHLNKGGSTDAVNRISGSMAYVALARAAWLLMRDPEDYGRRLLLSIKNNLAPDPWGLAFRIEAGRVQWEDAAVMRTANDLLRESAARESSRGVPGAVRESAAVRHAAEWLRVFLEGDKRVLSEVLLEAAERAGHSRKSMYAAKNSLGVWAKKEGFGADQWFWFFPPAADADAAEDDGPAF
jgi:hypothetical protein